MHKKGAKCQNNCKTGDNELKSGRRNGVVSRKPSAAKPFTALFLHRKWTEKGEGLNGEMNEVGGSKEEWRGLRRVPSEGSSPGRGSRVAVTALYHTAPLL